MTDDQLELVGFLVSTLVLPVVVYIALRLRHPSQRGRRWAGFGCLWAGQLAVLMLLVAILALYIGRGCYRMGYPVAGFVYGGGGALLAAMAAVNAIRTFSLGVSILCSKPAALIRNWGGRRLIRAWFHLLGSIALNATMLVIPIPGRWTPAAFIVGVLIPIGLTSMIVLAVTVVSTVTHRLRFPG